MARPAGRLPREKSRNSLFVQLLVLPGSLAQESVVFTGPSTRLSDTPAIPTGMRKATVPPNTVLGDGFDTTMSTITCWPGWSDSLPRVSESARGEPSPM